MANEDANASPSIAAENNIRSTNSTELTTLLTSRLPERRAMIQTGSPLYHYWTRANRHTGETIRFVYIG